MKTLSYSIQKILILFIILLLLSKVYSHDQDVHKYLVWNAWELVKDYHNVNYTAMNGRIGPWWLGWYNDGPWYRGFVVTGAYREDEEDVMYWYNAWGTPTNTHFWDPENFECDNNPDNTKFKITGYCYENHLVKAKNYWRGKKFANDDWLAIKLAVVSGPNISFPEYYNLSLQYNDLGNVYKNNEIYVTSAIRNQPPIEHIYYNPPKPLMEFNLQGGTRSKIENICWEIVGRICHLLGDAGVPAHAHNDEHPSGDLYEYWIRNGNNYTEIDWEDAKYQAILRNQPTIVDVLDLPGNTVANDPLKFLFYTMNFP